MRRVIQDSDDEGSSSPLRLEDSETESTGNHCSQLKAASAVPSKSTTSEGAYISELVLIYSDFATRDSKSRNSESAEAASR